MPNANLYSIFNTIKTDAELLEAEIIKILSNKEKTILNIQIKSEKILSRRSIKKLEMEIENTYKLSRATVFPRYTEINDEYLMSIRELLIMRQPSAVGFLKNSDWIIDEFGVKIHVDENSLIFLKNLPATISNIIKNEIDKHVKVELIGKENCLKEINREEILSNIAEKESFTPPTVQQVEKPQESKPQKSFYKPKKHALVMQDGEEVVFGKPIDDKIIKIDELIVDAGDFLIKGDVFHVETREIPNRELTVLMFDITDGSSSVRVSKVCKNEEYAMLSSKIYAGAHLKVQGSLEYNVYDKENIIKPKSIVSSKAKERKDLNPDKRVELHLHSNMSTMDAINDISEFVKMAKDWGHKAIAITDHGVVQAFPSAMNAGKKHGVKIIYGVEAYYYDDTVLTSAVKNEKDYDIDDEIVIFDLETTGLRSKTEEIIEICAMIYKNGNKISDFHSYVKPSKNISQKITELTGITDEIVANQPDITEVFPKFIEFIGDRPVVAHNATFDMSFVDANCRKFNINKKFTSIDTLEMSRIIMDQISRHRLNYIAKKLNLGNFEHHRATEDTRILAMIYNKFINIIKSEFELTNINQLNDFLQKMKENKGMKKPSRTYHLLIYAKNYDGLKNLYKIISNAHLENYYSRPVITKSVLDENREGLIIGSACEAGELYSAILSCESDEKIEKIAKMMDFLEVQPLGNNQFLLEKEIVSSKAELMKINEQIINLGEKLSIPVVATGDVHFKNKSDEVFRRILMASKGFSDADNQPPLYFKTTDEMLADFDYLTPEKAHEIVITNTNLIADMCEDIKPVPSETYNPVIEGSAEELEQKSRDKVYELYGAEPNEIIQERLEYELKSINGNGFDVMYMIAQKLVSKSIEEGYLVGSRGSVGSSFVAFLSGITEVNSLPAHYRCPKCKNTEFYPNQGLCGCDMPDKQCPNCNIDFIKDGFDIPFATFLGFDGDKAPDIDLNFSGEYQERAHKHTEEIFGKDHVFRAGTIGTVADKTAFGYVKKYFEEREKIIPRAEQNRLSKGCTGVKRTTGQHPGGLMIVPKANSIYEFCPIQRPADKQDTDIITTHFDYHSIHDNLLKLDLLGHDDPTIIKILKEVTGVDPQKIPLDDPETMRIFTDITALGIEEDPILGKTGSVAVPEFGTKFVRDMLNATQPKTFDELVRISGLSHGTDVWLGNAHDLVVANVATLKEVICARDDIMNFLIAKGLDPKMSFTIMESVRKGKGLTEIWEEEMKKNSVPDWYIESCKKIKYMFPKAHAVAYVMMAFRIAWFKVHYPIAFYSAYFSIRAKSFDASIMTVGHNKIKEKITEIKKLEKPSNTEKDMLTTLEVCHEFYLRGFKFLPINIYESDINLFLIKENSLLPPFTSMPGLGEAAAESIIDERKKEKFISTEELQMRCSKVSTSVIETLNNAGALGDIPKTTQLSLF